MNITIFGTGYVGLVTGTCLADVGHDVLCVDVDAAKIEGLKQGRMPIFEPGLEELVISNHASGRLNFTTDAAAAVAFGDVQFIAVGTPPDEDGSADLKYVLAVARTIGAHLTTHKIVVNKSTVPVGTADKVHAAIAEQLKQRALNVSYDVVSNPEFLKEGAAIDDCMKPDRIVIGSDSAQAIATMKALYAPLNRNHERVVVMDIRSAELTKYAANAMLATKISFMNEIANIAERVGADVESVRLGIGSDPRIGYHFIYPGIGYGGSCFPKDVQALERTAQQHGYDARILGAVEAVNRDQKSALVRKMLAHYQGTLSGKTFALWGLAFKPNTDDMREAPSRVIIDALLDAGATVRAFDPEAQHEAERVFAGRAGITLTERAMDAVQGADALLIVTEWKAFWTPDFAKLKAALRDQVIFDGRNIFKPDQVRAAGLTYYGIGRR
jgi:UDPglucose 6-dehydrogenase